MINDILQAAGFVEDVTYTAAVFLHPPQRPFVVYFDDADGDGADFDTTVFEHSVRFELYAPNRASPESEQKLEAAMKARGVHYSRTARTWVESERYFLTVYEFDFTEKEITQ